MSSVRVVVLGATGYVGARLVPALLDEGMNVVAIARSASVIDRWPWGAEVTTIDADLTEPFDETSPLLEANDVVVHLVHSMTENESFSDVDRDIAERVAAEAAAVGVRRIVYLSGLGGDDEELSEHLASRHEVGRVLGSTGVDVVELRAALLLGSASASFELLRTIGDLGRVLPVPRSVIDTKVQPIAIEDALDDLLWAIRTDDLASEVREIGGPEAMTYAELIGRYRAAVHGDEFRAIPVPFVPNIVARTFLNAVSPLPKPLVASLVRSISHDVVVSDGAAIERPNRSPLTVDDAVRAAMLADEALVGESHWSDDLVVRTPEATFDVDPDWAGPTEFEDRRSTVTDRPIDALFTSITGVGGASGWLVAQPLWEIRGYLDKIFFGGVGHRRGRRHPGKLSVGDILDWWRVEALEPPHRLLLRAEMVMPGDGWLEWTLTPIGGRTEVVQRAIYRPTGVLGRAYWWALLPFHGYLFPRLLDRLVDRASADAAILHRSDAHRRPDAGHSTTTRSLETT